MGLFSAGAGKHRGKPRIAGLVSGKAASRKKRSNINARLWDRLLRKQVVLCNWMARTAFWRDASMLCYKLTAEEIKCHFAFTAAFALALFAELVEARRELQRRELQPDSALKPAATSAALYATASGAAR